VIDGNGLDEFGFGVVFDFDLKLFPWRGHTLFGFGNRGGV
jgi:hypothetical protein